MSNIFKFKPRKEFSEEIIDEYLKGKLEAGVYYSKIINAYSDETKSGNPLLRLFVKPLVFDLSFDFSISVSDIVATHYHFKVFCEAIDIDYPETGEINLDKIIGKKGFAKLEWNIKGNLYVKNFIRPHKLIPNFKE